MLATGRRVHPTDYEKPLQTASAGRREAYQVDEGKEDNVDATNEAREVEVVGKTRDFLSKRFLLAFVAFVWCMSVITFVLTVLMISGKIGNLCSCSDAVEGNQQKQVSESSSPEAQSSTPQINDNSQLLQENMTRLQETLKFKNNELEEVWEALRVLDVKYRNLTELVWNVSKVLGSIDSSGHNCCQSPPAQEGLQDYNISLGPIGPQGLPGYNGTQGLPGPVGPQGLPGYNGTQGLPGLIGTQGLPGYNGTQGLPGPIGPQGMPGYNGTQGPPGPIGHQGLPGCNGTQGLPGPIGPQGLPGSNGTQGLPGPIGPQGLPGNNGTQGLPGPIGPQGLPGYNGTQGPPGPIGPQGLPGYNGTQGLPGPVGPQGRPGYNGAQGPPGPIGPQGLPGYNGTQGPPGPIGAQGLPGYNGTQGPPGQIGLPGLTGSPGPAGQGTANFSQCVYKYKRIDGTPAVDALLTVDVEEDYDKRIIAVTCSTDDAKQYLLSSYIASGATRVYMCECKGSVSDASATSLACIIHYWECPLIT